MIAASGPPLVVSDFGIVRVQTDDGLEGLGEISMNGGRNGAIQCGDVNQLLAQAS
jgi:muconate cycloisomerase